MPRFIFLLRAGEEDSVLPVKSVGIVSMVELSLTSGSGMLVSMVGSVAGMVVGTVGRIVGVVAGALLRQPQAAQAKQRIAAAKIAVILFIKTS